MATLQKWVDRAMRWKVNATQYPPTVQLEDAQVIYHQIEDYIISAIWEGFFWDILTASTTVVSQSEYTIPTISSGNFNAVPKVESISIQYQANGEFLPAREVDRQTLLQTHDISWYEVNQSRGDPIYFIADNSTFIYPAPLEAVTNGIKFYGIKSLSDITLTTTEENMFWGKIPVKYYYLLSDGMIQFIEKWRGKDNESEIARQRFENEKLPKLVDKLGNRKVWISLRWSPDVSFYR